jgi:hypothetical protein
MAFSGHIASQWPHAVQRLSFGRETAGKDVAGSISKISSGQISMQRLHRVQRD